MLRNLKLLSILTLVCTSCAKQEFVEQTELEKEFNQKPKIQEVYELTSVKQPEEFVKYYLRSKIGLYNSNTLSVVAQNHYNLALENPENIKNQEEAFLLLLANRNYAEALNVINNKQTEEALTFEQMFNLAQLLAQEETLKAHELLKTILSEQERLPFLKILNCYFNYANHKNIETLKTDILAIKSSMALDAFKYYYIARAYEGAEKYAEAFGFYHIAFSKYGLKTETVFSRMVYVANKIDSTETEQKLLDNSSRYGKNLYLVDQAFIDVTTIKPLQNSLKDVAGQIFYDLGWSIVQVADSNLSGLNFLALADYIKPNDLFKFQMAKGYFANTWQTDAIELLKSINKDSEYYLSSQIILADILKRKEPKKAIEVILELKKLKRFNDYYLESIIGQIYLDEGQYKKAITSLSAAIKHDKTARLYFSRAVAYEKTNQIDLALQDLQLAYTKNPNNPIVLNYLGYLLIDLKNDTKNGLEYIEQAVRLDPTNPASLDSLGWAYINLKDYEKGLALLERAYSIDTHDPVITGHLGDAYYNIGRKKEAIIYWEKALELENNDLREKQRIEKQLYKYNK